MVQLTTHFSMNIVNFFDNNNTLTNFINNIAALLKISDTSRIKVVGIFSGSTIVTTQVTEKTASSPASDPTTDVAKTNADVAIKSNAFVTTMANVGPITQVSAVYVPVNDSPAEPANIALIAGVTIAGVAVFVGSFVAVLQCVRKRAKVAEEIFSHEDELGNEKSV
jgi:hypothetical protein